MWIIFNSWRDLSHPLAGGSEVFVDRIASGLAERGHRVSLVVGRPTAEHTYEVIPNGTRYSQYLRAPVTHAVHLRKADVVVDVCNGMTYFTPLWRQVPTVALVHHVHEGQWQQWFPGPVAAVGNFLERRVMPWAYRNSLTITVSDSSHDSLELIGVAPDRVRIVPNGVDLPTEVLTEARDPIYLCLARLVPHKRVHLAVEAWRDLQHALPGTLVIAGEGPSDASIRRLNVERVELLGRVSENEKLRLLDQCAALIHPSMLEGWGLVVMEAAAHGRPTLGFDVPGLRDSVIDGVTGLLAHSMEDFADKWVALASDDKLRRRLGAAARDRAALYSWDRSVKEFEAVLVEARSTHDDGKARRLPHHWHHPEQASVMKDVSTPPPTAWELMKLFRKEKHHPGPFYQRLAERSVARFPLPVADKRMLDLGCGHGEYTREFMARGAVVTGVDMDDWLVPEVRPYAARADATRLPFPDASFDLVFCSNLLEHTPDSQVVFDEIARVLVPGGKAWVSWTNWYSPWGGHEIVPLHYLGPRTGLRVWRRLFGEPRKNVPFDALWPTYVGEILRLTRRHPHLTLLDAVPRYYPSQRWILRVPGLREVVTWNSALTLERNHYSG